MNIIEQNYGLKVNNRINKLSKILLLDGRKGRYSDIV